MGERWEEGRGWCIGAGGRVGLAAVSDRVVSPSAPVDYRLFMRLLPTQRRFLFKGVGYMASHLSGVLLQECRPMFTHASAHT